MALCVWSCSAPLLYLAIIVQMYVIIHHRFARSIREERTLDKRNVWYLRAIGMLTIVTELMQRQTRGLG